MDISAMHIRKIQLKIPTKKYAGVHEINLRSQETAAPIVHTHLHVFMIKVYSASYVISDKDKRHLFCVIRQPISC